MSYETLKYLLQERLSASRGAEQISMKNSSIKQGDDETAKNYYKRFREIVGQGDTSESSPFVLLHFQNGFKPKIRGSVLDLAGKSLAELLQVATSVKSGLYSSETVREDVAANYQLNTNSNQKNGPD